MFINNKKLITGLISAVLLFIFIFPVASYALDPLVTCGNSVTVNGVTTIPNPCNFNSAIGMINNIINWIISIAGVIFTISFIYGGFLWILSGENPGKKGDAKKVLWNTLLGFVIILTAWIIVHEVLRYLVPADSSIYQFIGRIGP